MVTVLSRSARFSPCRTWRYSLTRRLAGGGGSVAFVGLNPSRADETADDPTIRRCLGFASRWGFEQVEIVNLYGFRTPDPRELWRASDPVGPENDAELASVLAGAELVVAAWGFQARPDRLAELQPVFDGYALHAFGSTAGGAPRHPLYLRRDAELHPYERRSGARGAPLSSRSGRAQAGRGWLVRRAANDAPAIVSSAAPSAAPARAAESVDGA